MERAEHVAKCIVDAHVKAVTIALQTLQPHLVTVIRRAMADTHGGDDTWRRLGDVTEDLFDKMSLAHETPFPERGKLEEVN